MKTILPLPFRFPFGFPLGACVGFALAAPASGAADANLVLRYTFEESAGTTVVDSSGHGFNGTYVNSPAWGAGVGGKSLKLAGGPRDAAAPHVKLPAGVLAGCEKLTVTTWVKWDSDMAWHWLFGLGIDREHYLFLTPKSNGGTLFSALKNGGGEQGLGAPALPRGEWRHVAVTVDPAARKSVLYIDGAKVAENTNVSIRPSDLLAADRDYSGYIGKSFYPDPYFQGEVDDFRIYSTALTPAQVSDVYGEGMPAAQAVALVKANLGIGRAIVSADIALPASSYGASVTWKSGNPAIIANNGKVTRPAKGQPVAQVPLTATIAKNGVTDTKVFNLNVLPVGHTLPFESYNPVLKRDAAGNPLFTADPATLVVGDTLYVYAGRDEASIGGWFNMKEWVCFSTKDMIEWTYEGVAMKAADFKWGTPNSAWACQVVAKNGKYYLYSTTGRPNKGGLTVGIAVSDKPTGPFVDAKDGPLFDNAITTDRPVDSMEDIDPTVFIDDDGQAYLYWGNGTLHYALLSDDMLSLKDLNGDGRITEGADVFSHVRINNMQGSFSEAPWLHKRNGKYYLVYASDMPQKVRYAMSDSPRGPWEFKGMILGENVRPDGSRGPFNSDTSHPAVVDFKGRSYVFYHNSAQPTGGQTRRSVCVQQIHYNPDGTIQTARITSTGLTGQAFRIASGRTPNQALTFDNFDVKLAFVLAGERAPQWEVLVGLAEESTVDMVSIQPVAHPGYYVTVEGDALVLAKNDGTADFKRKATFWKNPAPTNYKLTVFQSLSDQTKYIRQADKFGKLHAGILPLEGGSGDVADAYFQLTPLGGTAVIGR